MSSDWRLDTCGLCGERGYVLYLDADCFRYDDNPADSPGGAWACQACIERLLAKYDAAANN